MFQKPYRVKPRVASKSSGEQGGGGVEIKAADDLYGNYRTAELGRSHHDFREPRNRKERYSSAS